MYELRPLKPVDILEIKDNLMAGNIYTPEIMYEVAQKAVYLGRAYTFLKDGKVVGCTGEVNLEVGYTDVWAFYSKDFSCFTRARAMVAFRALLPMIKDAGKKARIKITPDLKNSNKYAEFMGFTFIKTESVNVYEVA